MTCTKGSLSERSESSWHTGTHVVFSENSFLEHKAMDGTMHLVATFLLH